MPVVVVTLITVGTLLGVFKVTTNTAVAPSVIIGLLMVTIGSAVPSTIVPVAVATVVMVFVETIVPVKVNVSVPSISPSIDVGTLTVTLVAPAGMVTDVVVVV